MDVLTLSSGTLAVVVTHDGGMPEIASIGPEVNGFSPAAASIPLPHASLDTPVPIGVIAEGATGYQGRPGVVGARHDGTAWSPRFTLTRVVRRADCAATFELGDDVAELELVIDIDVDDVLTVSAAITNTGAEPYGLQRLAVTIPMPDTCEELMGFSGRWCREFQTHRSGFEGATVVANRTGRTSHAQLPAMFAGTSGFGEDRGEVWGAQLAWSGNYELAAERAPDGRRSIQVGELLSPGELELGAGESYRTPDVVVAWSDHGLTAVSQAFHRHVRSRLPVTRPRPVILNTWEAVYFDHRLDVLQELADVAADVGVERFVLDDGWFGGRRDDTAGLGDWWVSDSVWPSGLGPIVDHVHGRGMEFGLWVEPEMVNPDSELFRTHPEWTLWTSGYEPVEGRQQLVLDLGRPEVREFLFEALHGLVVEYDIAFLKWDMNREIVQGSRGGRPGTHAHVLGMYELMDRLRAATPGLEIESCASGGGRADLGVLRRTERIWVSDCNDALERQSIQRGFSMLFPPEAMGAHIGPDRAHTTDRRQDLAFRAATALFGHLGVEWNLLRATPDERKQVAAAIAIHKAFRPLLHGGDVVRVDHPDPAALVHGVVSDTRDRALFAYVQLSPSATTTPAAARFVGLDEDRSYRCSVVQDIASAKEFGRTRPEWMRTDLALPGSQLVRRGLKMPVLHPESVLLIEFAAVSNDQVGEDETGD